VFTSDRQGSIALRSMLNRSPRDLERHFVARERSMGWMSYQFGQGLWKTCG
jgi:hypothetical protein